MGADFDAKLLPRIGSVSEWAASDALVEADGAALVDGLRFRHDRIQQAVYAAVPQSRGRLLHGLALEALRVTGSGAATSALLASRHVGIVVDDLAAPTEFVGELERYEDNYTW